MVKDKKKEDFEDTVEDVPEELAAELTETETEEGEEETDHVEVILQESRKREESFRRELARRDEETKVERERQRKETDDLKQMIMGLASRQQQPMFNVLPPTALMPQNQPIPETEPRIGTVEYFMKRMDSQMDRLSAENANLKGENTKILLQLIEAKTGGGNGGGQFNTIANGLMLNLLNKTIEGSLGKGAIPASAPVWERIAERISENPTAMQAVMGSLGTIVTSIANGAQQRKAGDDPYAQKGMPTAPYPQQILPNLREQQMLPPMNPGMTRVDPQPQATPEQLSQAVENYMKEEMTPQQSAPPVNQTITEQEWLSAIMPKFTADLDLAKSVVKNVVAMSDIPDPQSKLFIMRNVCTHAGDIEKLGSMVLSVRDGKSTPEGVANLIVMSGSAPSLVQYPFDYWMKMVSTIKDHPVLVNEYKFLTGDGRPIAEAIYNSVRKSLGK